MSFLIAIILGLTSLVAYGLSDYFGSKVAKRLGFFRAGFASRFMSFVLVAVLFVLFSLRLPPIDFQTSILLAIWGIIDFAGMMAFFKGFEIGSVSVVAPLANSSSIVTVILLLAILKTPITGIEAVSVIAIISGAILVSFELKDLKRLKFNKLVKGSEYAVLAMFLLGFEGFLTVVLIKILGWFVVVFLGYGLISAYGFLYAFTKHMKFSYPRQLFPTIAMVGGLASIGYITLSLGISLGYPIIVIPLACSSTALTVFLALTVLKEKPELNQKIGLILILIGLITLNL
jgi:uncharacterized membrane protein